MPQLGPHISISDEDLLTRVFGLTADAYESWPTSVHELAASLACELFLVRYNPFVNPAWVRESVARRLNIARPSLSGDYPTVLAQAVDAFWASFDADAAFKANLLQRLARILPAEAMVTRPNSLVECATDATDLRLELPMAVLLPDNAEDVRKVVLLANEMGFGIIPRGGGTGLTGGAIPSSARTVVLSLSKLKKIISVDPEAHSLCAQAGVITLQAIKAAEAKGLLLTVDPASKAASSLGGNISENSGGPFAFEYGTTIDNILSFRMVSAQGELIEVRRKDHPGHKIFPDEVSVFEVCGENGQVRDTITLSGAEVRKTGLGKDVTNKYLGGLPGVQKEGVDGIIIDACFLLHEKPAISRTLCLEFFGRSMHNAMLVIREVVRLRDLIRAAGDKVKISALEEFGAKYVKAIEYKKKSTTYEGDPISVLILQLDSGDQAAIDQAVMDVVDIAEPFDNVDIFVAMDDRQAEVFWEDRHKLSAIARRTSGFKINEDVVIPLDSVPDFSGFLENLNLIYLAKAYRKALNRASELPGVPADDEFIEMEREVAFNILKKKLTAKDISDQEFEAQVYYFFQDLRNRFPKQDRAIERIHKDLVATRIEIANHMHAGDGNCHVNLPVNSNDPDMLAQAYEAVDEVFREVLSLGGEITGEHGVGITKIGFLSNEKIAALREYKRRVDPAGVLNPGKLTQRILPRQPYTFSFNRLIQDLDTTALKDKERLTELLRNIQACTRCGKCKQACAMYHPQAGLMYHPRNKNIALGALTEAIYYSQHKDGRPDEGLLGEMRDIMDHCTACGKCTAVCPIKIDSAKAALLMRAFLEEKGQGGHPVKTRALQFLAMDPAERLPKAAKLLSVGQAAQNKALSLIPSLWRKRAENPLFQGPGPHLDFRNLAEILDLGGASLFQPQETGPEMGRQMGQPVGQDVFYFPGCGASLFSRSIGMAALYLLLKAGTRVALPDRHLCCGYPLLASGLVEAYNTNTHRAVQAVHETLAKAGVAGWKIDTVLTSCGTCREAVGRFGLEQETGLTLDYQDVSQYVLTRLPEPEERDKPQGLFRFRHRLGDEDKLIFHAACHAEFSGLPGAKAAEGYRKALADYLHTETALSPFCCGESGLGAMTSPHIYNHLRQRKKEQLDQDLADSPKNTPVLVGCPSCKVGIKRSLMQMRRHNPVLHALEYLALASGGPKWKKDLLRRLDAAERRDGVVLVGAGD